MDLLDDGPPDSDDIIILAHGAGGPMDSPFMNTVARGLASEGLKVIRFEFSYMEKRRREGSRRPPDREPLLRARWREVVASLEGRPVVIGGKSLGGRMASMEADALGVRGLVCFGYPFHPPGKPEKLRTAHLRLLQTPALILQGTRDPFGNMEEVGAWDLAPTIRFVWLPDGDHSFKPRASAPTTEPENLRTAVAEVASFVRGLP